MRIFLVVFTVLLSTQLCFGQSGLPSLDELSFDFKYCGGAVYKHTKKVNIDPPPFSQEIEFSISHRTFGKRQWEQINNYPTPSINFCYSQYGDQLGNAISFYPGIEWSVLRKQKLNWRFKVGGGIGLATDFWSRGDTLNNYLGSQLNNFTVIQTSANYQISKKIELQMGGRMSHISNGAFRNPNFGINLFSGYVGVNYYPGGIKKLTRKKHVRIAGKRKINLGLRSSISWTEQNIPDGIMHTVLTQTVYAATPLKKKHLFFAGADIARNNKALSAYKYTQSTGNLNWSATSSSIFVGVELLYGRVGLPFQFGVYTKKLRNQDAVWYQKFGFQYYFYRNDASFLKRLYMGPMLKSNKINADYIEFSLGAMF